MPVWDSLNLNALHTERELSGTSAPHPDFPPLNEEWHVRHDDEIWCRENYWVADCSSEGLAQHIVSLHNATLRKVQ